MKVTIKLLQEHIGAWKEMQKYRKEAGGEPNYAEFDITIAGMIACYEQAIKDIKKVELGVDAKDDKSVGNTAEQTEAATGTTEKTKKKKN